MGVPPQEVSFDEKYTAGNMLRHTSDDQCLGSYKGLRHCVCGRRGLLQGLQRHCQRDQCEGHSS